MYIKDTRGFTKKINSAVCIYTCGPTIYNNHHIGNLRVCHTSSMLARYSEAIYGDYSYNMNFTDIGHLDCYGNDKVIDCLKKNDKHVYYKYIYKYAYNYVREIKENHMSVPSFHNASDYIDEYMKHIDILVDKNLVIYMEDGIYIDINKINIDTNYLMHKGSRIKNFCIWRLSKNGLFESKYGLGTPGWHIECFAILDTINKKQKCDVHIGGIDLSDIHHNCEIIHNYCCYESYNICELFIHVGSVCINNKKISKSDYDEDNNKILNHISPFSLNYLYTLNHYRSNINISLDKILYANKVYSRIANKLIDYMNSINLYEIQDIQKFIKKYINISLVNIDTQFIQKSRLSNDLNTFGFIEKIISYIVYGDIKSFAIYDYIICLNFIPYFFNRIDKVIKNIYLYNKVNYYRRKKMYNKSDDIINLMNMYTYKKNDYVYMY